MTETIKVVRVDSLNQRLKVIDEQIPHLQAEREFIRTTLLNSIDVEVTTANGKAPTENDIYRTGATNAVTLYLRKNPGKKAGEVANALESLVVSGASDKKATLRQTCQNLITRGILTALNGGGLFLVND